MIQVKFLEIEEGMVMGIGVEYPKTNLLSLVVPDVGYIMCGMLHIENLDAMHGEREIIAAQVRNVKEFSHLLTASIVLMTKKAEQIGIMEGMSGEEALNQMLRQKEQLEAPSIQTE